MFEKEFLEGAFTPSEESIRLHSIAKEYHRLCDEYDQKVCGRICEKTGEAMPVSNWELSKINAYAYDVKQMLYKENPDISPEAIRRAIREY